MQTTPETKTPLSKSQRRRIRQREKIEDLSSKSESRPLWFILGAGLVTGVVWIVSRIPKA